MNLLNYLQSAIAFATGICSLYVVYSIFNRAVKSQIQLEKPNMAFAVLQSGVILATAIMASSVVGPGINAIRLLNQANSDWQTMASSVAYMLGFLIIGIVFSLLVVAGGIVVLFQLTHVNEWEEIKNNHVPTALISAALIVGLSMMMKDQVTTLCEFLIPYPEIYKIK